MSRLWPPRESLPDSLADLFLELWLSHPKSPPAYPSSASAAFPPSSTLLSPNSSSLHPPDLTPAPAPSSLKPLSPYSFRPYTPRDLPTFLAPSSHRPPPSPVRRSRPSPGTHLHALRA
ncbi:hypothetical protein BN946_scf184473.g6 [Trametes cinnabarina]|uniref:Uncharacterized protein n=1 Tax=Pycnoporus cinnabarinus TaxID=5643 RepID=A0A060SR78_PYCCI|nr:hypothetical protein BN946_scf184473.g6 [Trametes cinnabarina]